MKKDLKEAILGIEVTQFDGQKADLEELVNPKQLEKIISDWMPEVLSQKWIERNTSPVDDEGRLYVWKSDLQSLLVPEQEEITHKQVEKYLLDKNIRVIDIDIYEEMQSELEELKNGATLSKTETVADVVTTFWKSYERLKEVMSMEVKEMEE